MEGVPGVERLLVGFGFLMASVGQFQCQWGGLWQTVCELPDAKDALLGLEHAAKGFAALEAARTLADVKTVLLQWFGDKHTRNHLNSPLLDQLYLLLTVPFKQHPYIAATVLGFPHALQFLLRLDDAPDKRGRGMIQVLGWAREHHQDAVVKYLSNQGVPCTLLVLQTPFQEDVRVYTRVVERKQDVLHWIEPVTNGEPVTLSGNGNVLFNFSERLVFNVPFPQILLYLTHFEVSGPVRCGCGDLTESSRKLMCDRNNADGFGYKQGGQQFRVCRGVIGPSLPFVPRPLSNVDINELSTGNKAVHVAALPALAHPDLSDEVVNEIKRLTGWSWMRLFGLG